VNTSVQAIFRLLPVALVAAQGFIVTPENVARAAPLGDDTLASVTVSFSDLDLSKPQGTAVLYLRIRNAARVVCGPVDIALLEEQASWVRCVNEAIATGVAKVGNANLTAYYLDKTNGSPSLVTARISKPTGAH
jgi:UrcA family protein